MQYAVINDDPIQTWNIGRVVKVKKSKGLKGVCLLEDCWWADAFSKKALTAISEETFDYLTFLNIDREQKIIDSDKEAFEFRMQDDDRKAGYQRYLDGLSSLMISLPEWLAKENNLI